MQLFGAQVVALPPVELVSQGLLDPHSIAACNEKVDIWALGITLYELLTGRNPPPLFNPQSISVCICTALHRLPTLVSTLFGIC